MTVASGNGDDVADEGMKRPVAVFYTCISNWLSLWKDVS